MSRRVLIAANSAWNIVNFRLGLVRALKEAGYDPIVVAPSDSAAEGRMRELGVDWIAVDIDRSGLNPFADLGLLQAYRRILRDSSAVAFLGFTVKPNIYGALAARLRGVPAIVNLSGLGTAFQRSGPLQLLVSSMYRFALRRAHTVFFQNQDDLDLFVSNGIVDRAQTCLLPGSGIDLQRFAPSPLPEGPPTFLLIARLLRDKGIYEFVEAATEVRRDYPDARFQVLGPLDPGNRTSIRREELDRWVSQGAIEYLGMTDDVRPLVASASAIVLPSYREGMPRSLLEGAAMARPLIATDVPGCRHLVTDGVNGFLCDARSAQSLAAVMSKFCKLSPGQRMRMGLAARATAEQRFGEGLVIQAYLDALKSLLGKSIAA